MNIISRYRNYRHDRALDRAWEQERLDDTFRAYGRNVRALAEQTEQALKDSDDTAVELLDGSYYRDKDKLARYLSVPVVSRCINLRAAAVATGDLRVVDQERKPVETPAADALKDEITRLLWDIEFERTTAGGCYVFVNKLPADSFELHLIPLSQIEAVGGGGGTDDQGGIVFDDVVRPKGRVTEGVATEPADVKIGRWIQGPSDPGILLTAANTIILNANGFISPLAVSLDAIKSIRQMNAANRNFFRNGMLGTNLVFKLRNVAPGSLDQFKKDFKRNYAGTKGSGEPLVVDADETDVTALRPSNRDLEYKDGSILKFQEVGQAYGVPMPQLFDTEASTFNNVANSKREFYQGTIAQEWTEIASMLTKGLRATGVLDPTQHLYFDTNKIEALRTPLEERGQGIEYLIKSGFTMNEIRAREGLEPLPDPLADKPLIRSDTIALEDLESLGGVPAGGTFALTPVSRALIRGLSKEDKRLFAQEYDRRYTARDRSFQEDLRGLIREVGDRVIPAVINQGKALKAQRGKRGTLVLSDFYNSDHWQARFEALGKRFTKDVMFSESEIVARRFRLKPLRGAQFLIEATAADRAKFWAGSLTQTMGRELSRWFSEATLTGDFSIPDLAEDIRTRFGKLTNVEAERIARTETGYAANRAQVETYRLNKVSFKEWLPTNDDRTRPTHADAAGIYRIDEPINVGGENLDTPNVGFQGGAISAGNAINCRCVVLPSDG